MDRDSTRVEEGHLASVSQAQQAASLKGGGGGDGRGQPPSLLLVLLVHNSFYGALNPQILQPTNHRLLAPAVPRELMRGRDEREGGSGGRAIAPRFDSIGNCFCVVPREGSL